MGAKVDAHPELVAQIVKEGHFGGKSFPFHTVTRTNFFAADRLRAELEQAQAAIARSTGKAPENVSSANGIVESAWVFRAARAA